MHFFYFFHILIISIKYIYIFILIIFYINNLNKIIRYQLYQNIFLLYLSHI
jgi:hypothetical protein